MKNTPSMDGFFTLATLLHSYAAHLARESSLNKNFTRNLIGLLNFKSVKFAKPKPGKWVMI